jgi:CheY-like chemotaxis protein
MKGKTIPACGRSFSALLPCKPILHRRILVVDDEPLIRKLNSEVLLDAGYQVDAAEDGAVAWAALQLFDYDLLITDNNMPNVSGIELLQKLHAGGVALPVIMATGTPPAEEFSQAPWLQPAVILLKPYAIAQLLDAVQKVLPLLADEPGRFFPLPACQPQLSAAGMWPGVRNVLNGFAGLG